MWEYIGQNLSAPLAPDDDFCLSFKPIALLDPADRAGGMVVQLLDDADNIVALLSWNDKSPESGYGGITAKIEGALVYGQNLKCDSEYPTINEVLKLCREGTQWSVWVGDDLKVGAYEHPGTMPIVKVKIGFFDLSEYDERDIKVDFIEVLKIPLGGNITALTVIEPDTLFTIYAQAVDFTSVLIYVGDFTGGYVAGDVNPASILINGTLAPVSTAVIPTHPNFTGEVLELTVSTSAFIGSYADWWDWSEQSYSVTGTFNDAVVFSASGLFDARGHISGDVNNDGLLNVSDVFYLIEYIYMNGQPPRPFVEVGDFNHDGEIDLGDILDMITDIYVSPSN